MKNRLSPHGIYKAAYRPVVMGRKGMVSSGHPLASQAGIGVLRQGGNAVDAAIAVAAATSVVEPLMSGIGGDGFMMIYWRDSDEIKVVNATGAAPFAATRDRFLSSGIPFKGILSVSVPGLLDGWIEAHQRYGRLNLRQVLEPAIELSESGFPVSHKLAEAIAVDTLLCEFPTSRAVFTRDGIPLKSGEILYQKDLAKSLQIICEQGREALYSGSIGQGIDKFMREQGGLLTLEDLKGHRTRWQDPISISYHGYDVYEAPPNSSGHVLLQELNLVENFDLNALGCNTAESIHLMVEAKRMAFADREAYVADPEFVDVPIDGLLSKEYAAERAKLIDLDVAATRVNPGEPWMYQTNGRPPKRISKVAESPEDTTCFVVVDQWGNAVSQLQSIQSAFGSSLIAGDTGILLNNRMTYWHLEEDHVDVLKPGKRVRHTMNPVMVFRRNRDTRDLSLVCGTPGADTQVQTNLQVVTHVLDFGMTVQEAVEAPRWRHLQNLTESTYPHTADDQINMEGRFSEQVFSGLENRGHKLVRIGDWEGVGSQVMIQIDPDEGALHGGADPRRDGYVVGW
ncbi:gamma-glutamyltransferase [SAR202 cluster bacterium AD-804-J14_MRT_500m]|nr:gamma-glutamyltransferase [SAR202 cluster bacterium AD-804-J14_MRT_500m]